VVIALKGMLGQGWGSIYNMEGLGSSGPMIRGLSLYATSKSGLSYFTKALASETAGTGVIAGAIRPGMVVTKLITDQYRDRLEEWERFKKIFNILGDRVETVTPWLAGQILENRKNGRTISWMGRGKATLRFLTSPLTGRRIID
jgi:NAD(P)-dependent dehydrogenase (short-subunit alcohol dehydrogenase family)